MDVLYKGDYTAYMDFTGTSRTDVSLYRDQWLSESTDAFLTAFGAGQPSEETTDRISGPSDPALCQRKLRGQYRSIIR